VLLRCLKMIRTFKFLKSRNPMTGTGGFNEIRLHTASYKYGPESACGVLNYHYISKFIPIKNLYSYSIHTTSRFLQSSSTKKIITEKNCHNCGHQLSKNEFFCSACEHLTKLEDESLPNYFEILKMPESYAIDVSEIPTKMRSLQKILHPDLFTLKGEVSCYKYKQNKAKHSKL